MVRVCSMFSQILGWFPRLEFDAAVREHKAERHARGFTCWQQFVAMLFCQLGHAQSLREICGGLAATDGNLRHLGVLKCPKATTLSYANAHRPWQLYQRRLSFPLTNNAKQEPKFRFYACFQRGPFAPSALPDFLAAGPAEKRPGLRTAGSRAVGMRRQAPCV
jgi:hypothetical protein